MLKKIQTLVILNLVRDKSLNGREKLLDGNEWGRLFALPQEGYVVG